MTSQPRDTSGFGRSDFRLPSNNAPVERRCIKIYMPDEPAHLWILRGLLSSLGIDQNWSGGTQAEREETAEMYRQIINEIPWNGDCDVPEFRFTMECGLEFSLNGVDWTPVSGWDTFSALCYTGETGAAGAAGHGVYIHETATGLMQSDEADFDPETLIYAYYRADATRRASAFLANGDATKLVLHNAAAVQKLSLGLVSGVNELDTRESQMLVRFGASTTNTRRMYFNGDGTIQFVNSVVTPSAKFEVYNDVSALDVVKFEGRTGQATGTAVLHMGVVNQEGAGFDGDAIRIRGLNSASATRSTGILKVDKHGRLLNSDYHQLQVLSTGVTPSVYKTAAQRTATLLDMSGTNYRTRVIETAYKDGSPVETMRSEIQSDGDAAIGFLGHTSQSRVDLGVVDCAGNDAAYAALQALISFGLADGTVSLGTVPEPEIPVAINTCQIANAAARIMFHHFYARAAEHLEYSDIGLDVFTRQDDIESWFDVRITELQPFLDWSEHFWADYGNNSDHAGYLLHIGFMQLYFESNAAEIIYCYLDENGIMTDENFLSMMVKIEENSTISDTTLYFYEFMKCWNFVSMAGFIAMGKSSSYVYEGDCDFSCDNWSQSMEFNLDDWSDSVDLITGNYSSGIGYTDCESAVIGLEIPFRITYANFRVGTDTEGATPDEIRVQDRATGVWTNITPFMNFRNYEWFGDAAIGIKIEVTAPSCDDCCAIIERLYITGLGTQPLPDE